MINFEYLQNYESFVNLTTNNYDVIVWEGGRGGAKSQTLACIGVARIIY